MTPTRSRSSSREPRKAGTRGVPRAVRERQILDVAGRVFAERGYHAASMDEIAGAAGVTKPLVYAYFGSKERLYVAYIERAGRELLERLRGAARPDAPADERLRAGVVEFLRFVVERGDGWRVLHAEISAKGGPLADQVAGLRAAIARMITRLLAETAGAEGRAAPAAPVLEGAAHAVVGAGESLANWRLAHPELAAEQAAELLVVLGRAAAAQALAAPAQCPVLLSDA